MRRVDLRVVALSALLVVATGCGSDDASRSAVPRERIDVLAIGDSLLHESRAAVLAGLPGERVRIRSVPGAALCDLRRRLSADLSRWRPRLVVIESVGNGLTRCIRGAGALGSAAFTRQYRRDLQALIAAARAARAQVLVVDPPPLGALSATSHPALTDLARQWRADARHTRGVTFTAAPRDAVSDRGRYAAALPCERTELSRSECRNGLIAIRDGYFGVHFCPMTYADASAVRRRCAVYSSGARRFGDAIARVIRDRTRRA